MNRFAVGITLVCCLLVFAPAFAGLEEGIRAVEAEEFDTALEELKPLAEKGNIEAQNQLALMYLRGQGVEANEMEAAHWFQLAAEAGHPQAQNNLAMFFYVGGPVPQDYIEALKWFRKAAEQDFARAQGNLGVMYVRAEGTKFDIKEAYFWFALAVRNGFDGAAERRNRTASQLSDEEFDEMQARIDAWFEGKEKNES